VTRSRPATDQSVQGTHPHLMKPFPAIAGLRMSQKSANEIPRSGYLGPVLDREWDMRCTSCCPSATRDDSDYSDRLAGHVTATTGTRSGLRSQGHICLSEYGDYGANNKPWTHQITPLQISIFTVTPSRLGIERERNWRRCQLEVEKKLQTYSLS
jgi:hypothetical protein